MANYDSPGLTYGSGVLYDDTAPPQPSRLMAKIKVKLNLDSKSDANLLTFAQAHAIQNKLNELIEALKN